MESDEIPLTRKLLVRARTWGLLTIRLATGSARPTGCADHSLSIDSPLGLYGRETVLSYHLLWELTHVCLEHPGLLARGCGSGEVCVTCSDEGRPAEIVSCDGSLAMVRSALGTEQIDVSLVQPVTAGTSVLVHAGVAISRLDTDGEP